MLLIRVAGTLAKCVYMAAAGAVWRAGRPNGRSFAFEREIVVHFRGHAFACDVDIGISRIEVHCMPVAVRYILVLVGVVFIAQISLPLRGTLRGRVSSFVLVGDVSMTRIFLRLRGGGGRAKQQRDGDEQSAELHSSFHSACSLIDPVEHGGSMSYSKLPYHGIMTT